LIHFLTSSKILPTVYHKKSPANRNSQGPSIDLQALEGRRQRERRNRRKNLWGNVSLLRGWQQHQLEMLLLTV
jgi:hypothetical protein